MSIPVNSIHQSFSVNILRHRSSEELDFRQPRPAKKRKHVWLLKGNKALRTMQPLARWVSGYIAALVVNYGISITIKNCWLSGKLWYLQHNCVGDTIVYHKGSIMRFSPTQDQGTHIYNLFNPFLQIDFLIHKETFFVILVKYSWYWVSVMVWYFSTKATKILTNT